MEGLRDDLADLAEECRSGVRRLAEDQGVREGHQQGLVLSLGWLMRLGCGERS